jgi:hypothetical protein
MVEPQLSYDIIDDETDTHFITFERSDSPITMSNNSDDESGHDSGSEHESLNGLYSGSLVLGSKFRKLTYNDVERSLDKYYNKDSFSSEFDILTTYLKGQKNIYMQSRIISQRNLHLLSAPTMFLTASMVVFAPFTIDFFWGGIVVSVINAIIVLLLSVISYLKLESAIEMYTYLYNQYDKMELSLELAGNKLIYADNMKEHEQMIIGKIKEVEWKITDIKESHISVTYPNAIKKMFPVICHINIFSFIKKIEVYKRGLIIRFKDVKNEIRYILFKARQSNDNQLTINDSSGNRMESRLARLMDTKNKIREELLHYKMAYRYIDEIFTREIKHVENYNCYWFRPPVISYKYSNPVIKEYLEVIFDNC